jgi:fructose-bisphosphate aldolase class II
MPIMTTKPMFDLAYAGGFAVGAFNVNYTEITQGIHRSQRTAEKSPLILQIFQGCAQVRELPLPPPIIAAASRSTPELADRSPISITATRLTWLKTCINERLTVR